MIKSLIDRIKGKRKDPPKERLAAYGATEEYVFGEQII